MTQEELNRILGEIEVLESEYKALCVEHTALYMQRTEVGKELMKKKEQINELKRNLECPL